MGGCHGPPRAPQRGAAWSRRGEWKGGKQGEESGAFLEWGGGGGTPSQLQGEALPGLRLPDWSRTLPRLGLAAAFLPARGSRGAG